MQNYRLVFDFERDCDHIQNIRNIDEEQKEFLQIEYFFPLPMNSKNQ